VRLLKPLPTTISESGAAWRRGPFPLVEATGAGTRAQLGLRTPKNSARSSDIEGRNPVQRRRWPGEWNEIGDAGQKMIQVR
jgi:hypothetical protein